MFKSHLDGCGNDLDQLGRGKVFWAGGPSAIGVRAAVKATLVTLVGKRDAEVIYLSIKRIGEGISHSLKSAPARYSIRNLR